MPRTARLGWWLPTLIIVACAGPSAETAPGAVYAKEVERLVVTLNATVGAHDATADALAPSLERERARFDGALAARDEFLDGAAALEAPEPFAVLHDRAAMIIGDLRDATAVLAEAAHSAETYDDWTAIWRGPAGERFRAADARTITLCWEVQAFFDAGLQQASEFASPWLRTSEVGTVTINLGCEDTG